MSFRRHSLVFALVALVSVVAAPAAWAEITVPASGIDWAAGTVTVSADYPAGTRSVIFSAAGQAFVAVSVADDTVAGTISAGVPVSLTGPTDFSAEARDALNASIGFSTLTLTPEMYRPAAPRLELRSGTIVDPLLTVEAVSNFTVTSVTVETAPESHTQQATLLNGVDGRIAVTGLHVPYGIETIKLIAHNGFGSSPPSGAETVYSLGRRSKLPRSSRYILVDKHSMTLYDIRGQRVIRHYDIAVGTPSTPTPNGFFKIGAPRRSSGAWGPMRRPLYRFHASRLWPTGFYIHGTNAPWDIGTWASHGCVRMYDWAIRRLSKTVPSGTLVLIRP